jgi:hypothetical protein
MAKSRQIFEASMIAQDIFAIPRARSVSNLDLRRDTESSFITDRQLDLGYNPHICIGPCVRKSQPYGQLRYMSIWDSQGRP